RPLFLSSGVAPPRAHPTRSRAGPSGGTEAKPPRASLSGNRRIHTQTLSTKERKYERLPGDRGGGPAALLVLIWCAARHSDRSQDIDPLQDRHTTADGHDTTLAGGNDACEPGLLSHVPHLVCGHLI